jgi:hypothetical protein
LGKKKKKNIKKDEQSGSSCRATAQQAWNPEFKLQYCPTPKRKISERPALEPWVSIPMDTFSFRLLFPKLFFLNS